MTVIEIIYEKQKDFGYIKKINVERKFIGEECFSYDLYITLCNYPYWDDEGQFTIKFSSIKDLKINDIDNLLKVCLNVRMIKDRQIENINFSVSDIENSLISFLCKDIQLL